MVSFHVRNRPGTHASNAYIDRMEMIQDLGSLTYWPFREYRKPGFLNGDDSLSEDGNGSCLEYNMQYGIENTRKIR